MEKKVIDYNVVTACYHDDFVSLVRERMNEGWQPLGSVSVATCIGNYSGVQTTFAQAMVKYEFIPQSYTVDSEIEVEIPRDYDWDLALATSRKITEMGLTSKTISMKQMRYIKKCLFQGKEITLADVMSIK